MTRAKWFPLNAFNPRNRIKKGIDVRLTRLFCAGVLIFALCLLASGPAWCEYYQYTDENGNLCFTDDKSMVPEDQLDDAKSYDSLNYTEKPASMESKSRSGLSRQKAPEPRTWDGKLQSDVNSLDEEKDQLDRTFQRLQKEKEALVNQSSEDMSPAERSAYKDRVHELNERIEAYDKKREEFQQKVDRFNAQVRQEKAEEDSDKEEP